MYTKLLKRETKSTINRSELSIMIVITVNMKVISLCGTVF